MKTQNYTTIISSPIGKLGIQIHEDKLARIAFLPENTPEFATQNAYAHHVIQQLNAYFNNPRHSFDITITRKGTTFQTNVWNALEKIPSGKTFFYSEFATQLETGPRAIGSACRTNPTPVVVPCHRIIAKQTIGGFAGEISGDFIQIKQWLLQHESL